ncbi:MAG: nucleotide exchange factor GrpE [Acidobacteriota bacterium]
MTDEEKNKPSGENPSDEVEYISQPEKPGTAAAQAPSAPSAKEAPPAAVEKDSPQAARPLKEKLKKREAEIKALKKQIDELKDQYLRKMADVENLRKRLEREKSDYLQFALSDVLLELLGIRDNFERALQSSAGDADGKTFREGVELIYRMWQNFLFKRGVRPIVIKDGLFDPSLHQAMAAEESPDVTEPRVEEELQKGYMLHERLLRPALVRVVVPKKD